jgi:hypothetical protein
MAHLNPITYLIALLVFMSAHPVLAVGLPNVPGAHHNPHHNLGPENPVLLDALFAGKFDLWIRTRYEDVKDDIPDGSTLADADKAHLLSTRIQAGYTTARWRGFYLRGEGEWATRIGSDNNFDAAGDLRFPPGPAGSRIADGNALIPDSNFLEINEAFIGWQSATGGCPNAPGPCNGTTSVKLGRQSIIYDNHRWVGDIVWRNNNQSYDALRIDNSSIKNVNLSYSNIKKAKRTFGEASPFNEWKFNNGHLINVSYKFPIGKLVGYGYLLDFKDNHRTPFPEGVGKGPGIVNFDSDTWGLRFFGKYPLGNAFDLLYDVEYANQDPTDSASPALDDNNYTNIELGVRFGGTRVDGLGLMPIGEPTYILEIGQETLEGNGVNALQTPLATVHAFNGWTDKFVGAPGGSETPVNGLVDTSLTATVLGLGAKFIGKNKIVFQYHDYESDRGSTDYGKEWGILWAKPDLFGNENVLGAIKYADYDADDFSDDTEKFWFLMQYRFK